MKLKKGSYNCIYDNKIFDNYSISNKGIVTNISSGRVMKPWDDSRGYDIVDLMHNNVAVRCKVHLLAAQSYGLKKTNESDVLHHKDSNKKNNSKDNIEFITQQMNVRDAIINVKGQRYLSDKELKKVKEMISSGGSTIKEIGTTLDIPYHVVRDIKHGKTYKINDN